MSDTPAEMVLSATNEQLLSYIGWLDEYKRPVTESTGIYRAGIKRHENGGVHTKAGLHVYKLAKKGKAAACEFLLQEIRFAAVLGLLDHQQLQIFSDLNSSVAAAVMHEFEVGQAASQGWKDGHSGVPESDIPYPLGTEHAQAWAQMWARGAAAKERELGEGGRQASAERQQPEGRDIDADLATNPKVVRRAKANGRASSHSNGAEVTPKRRGRPPGSKNKKSLKLVELEHRPAA